MAHRTVTHRALEARDEMGRASERTVLVSGATSGIGAAISRRLLADGHSVIGIGRDFTKVDFPKSRFIPVVLDLAALAALPERLSELSRAHPSLDALVLNAGRGEFGGLEELSYDQIRTLIELNFTHHAFVVRTFLPSFKRRRQGDLIFIGSEAAQAGRRQGSIYCASKFALRGFAQALREECARSGVRVSSIHPGMVRSPFFAGLDFAPGDAPENALEPEEVAAAVAFVLAQRDGAVVDEIHLSPLKKVIEKRRPNREPPSLSLQPGRKPRGDHSGE